MERDVVPLEEGSAERYARAFPSLFYCNAVDVLFFTFGFMEIFLRSPFNHKPIAVITSGAFRIEGERRERLDLSIGEYELEA